MAPPKLTAKKVSDMRRQYQGGARDVDLAEWFSISETTVRYHTRDIRRKNPRRSFDYDRAADLHRQGFTKSAIASRFGVSDVSVNLALKRMKARAVA